jgi:hypothetical protein
MSPNLQCLALLKIQELQKYKGMGLFLSSLERQVTRLTQDEKQLG